MFSDGRPFRVEFWAASQISYLTYYFSSEDIENLSAGDLKEYLKAEYVIEFNDEKYSSSGFPGINVNAKKKPDASGNEVWEITVIVGDEEGKYIHDLVVLKRYPERQSSL